MKKPEKKIFKEGTGFISLTDREHGYNQACDEWEKYHEERLALINKNYIKAVKMLHKDTENLPSEEEIKNVFTKYSYRLKADGTAYKDKTIKILTKALSKRIGNDGQGQK